MHWHYRLYFSWIKPYPWSDIAARISLIGTIAFSPEFLYVVIVRPGRVPLSLVALQARFCDEEKCLALLERARWPAGPTCPHCGVIGHASRLKARPGQFACLDWGNLGACTGTVAEVDHQIVNIHPSALSGLSWINWNHRPASVGITVRLRSEFAITDPRRRSAT